MFYDFHPPCSPLAITFMGELSTQYPKKVCIYLILGIKRYITRTFVAYYDFAIGGGHFLCLIEAHGSTNELRMNDFPVKEKIVVVNLVFYKL